MKRLLIVGIILSVLFINGCTKNVDISQKDMALILEELYIVDQYTDIDATLYDSVGENQVYAPFIEKYGYTTTQFSDAIEYYRHNPEQFQEILMTVGKSLDAKFNEFLVAQGDVDTFDESDELVDDNPQSDNSVKGKRRHNLEKSEDEPEFREQPGRLKVKNQKELDKMEGEDSPRQRPAQEPEDRSKVKEKKISKKELEQLKNKWE